MPRFWRPLLFSTTLLVLPAGWARADIYTVTHTDDAGTGSLRWAISQANAHPGADAVAFNIPGPGVKVIAVQTPLPSLAAGTSIHGNTQPGYAGAPLIRLDGGDLPQNFWGLDTGGPSITIRGLQIVRFRGPGIRVWHDFVTIRSSYVGTDGSAALANEFAGIVCHAGTALVVGGLAAGEGNVLSGNGAHGLLLDPACTGAVIWGNRVGTNAGGTAAVPNQGDGLWIASAQNTVGGSGAGQRNLISGNAFNGIVLGDAAIDNQIVGNWIGTDTTGTGALGNGGSGVWIRGDANTLGGTAAGAGNLISGNGDRGVVLDAIASLNVLRGNRIGTDAAGSAALPNAGGGVALYGSQNSLGGAAAGARNVISGNAQQGIDIAGAGADANEIVGNHIGTDAAGAVALGNSGYGIRALSGVGNLVRGNVISGNGRALSLEHDARDYVVQGNTIGLDAARTAKLANDSSGLDISTPGHLVGGTQPGDGNVIAGNAYYGIWIDGPAATGIVVAGNWIGTNPARAPGLGNRYSGITVTAASGNTIGGTAPGAGNVIAHNNYLGVFVWSGASNAILGNSIHDNVLLGIDLEPQGPTPNDPGDWDLGANRGQNHPVVASAVANGGDLAIEGFLDAHPSTEYRIELFSSPTFDPTGVGEGRNFLGAVVATTDAAGRATFAATLPAAGGDAFVTATATGPLADTSELSPALAVGAPQPGQLQIWRDLLLAYEGTTGLAVTIVRSHGVVGTVAVEVATVDGTAQAPADFGAVATTLTFQPGETMKSVFVPVVTDGLPEDDETWALRLANPQGGAVLGANHDVDGWIFDATLEWPMYSVSDAQVVEGDTGTRNLVFTLTLSPTDHEVPIHFWTRDGTAAAGEDYQESSGVVTFQPGDGAKTIVVPVLGDTAQELDEVVYLHVAAAQGTPAVVWKGLGEGRILDDDGGGVGSLVLFVDDFESGAADRWSTIQGGS